MILYHLNVAKALRPHDPQHGVRLPDAHLEIQPTTGGQRRFPLFADAPIEIQPVLALEEPEIVKQGGRYGVKLKAQAPSIHMIRCNTRTEVAPIVGSESQSQELVMYLLREFQENPGKIWETDLFGKSLHELVNEGLRGKLERMPDDARDKFRETIERVINEGCSGLICIIL